MSQLLVFLFFVIAPVLIFRKRIKKSRKISRDEKVPVLFLTGAIGFIVWFIFTIICSVNTPLHWKEIYSIPIQSLTQNSYIKSTTSKSSVSNSTEERYDYFINDNGSYRSSWVNKSYADVKLKNGALELHAFNNVPDSNFISKYVVPSWIYGNPDVWYTFYVDPKYAADNLGINVQGR